jgi:hypothetical protein
MKKLLIAASLALAAATRGVAQCEEGPPIKLRLHWLKGDQLGVELR